LSTLLTETNFQVLQVDQRVLDYGKKKKKKKKDLLASSRIPKSMATYQLIIAII
jgi:hypothetical protein